MVFKSKSDKKISKSTKKAKFSQPELAGKKSKKPVIILIILFVVALIASAVVFAIFYFSKPEHKVWGFIEEEPETKYYSKLSGLEIANESLNNSPVYCVQIPNGDDGGRPQVGLNSASVVFEAIAEAGITRFAAIFQNADDAVIGPVRSIRPYYIDWDTPFDCTLVHSGSSDEAKAVLSAGKWRDLVESVTYMWRDYSDYIAPNNLFTSASLLNEFNGANGWNTSNPQVFKRLTPEQLADIIDPIPENNDEDIEREITTPNISITFSGAYTFNTDYVYNAETNSYDRSFGTGAKHYVYSCPAGVDTSAPQQNCTQEQVSPKAVVAMMVQETRLPNTRESIATTGSGVAYFFQNGLMEQGTWSKSSQDAQIIFRGANGEEFAFTPGQLWIAAVPQYGTVKY